jgi:hypothetical protein
VIQQLWSAQKIKALTCKRKIKSEVFRALKVTSKCKSKKEHNIEKTKQMQELARRKEIKREERKLKMKKRTTQHYKVT